MAAINGIAGTAITLAGPLLRCDGISFVRDIFGRLRSAEAAVFTDRLSRFSY